jgi:hypothetical protein
MLDQLFATMHLIRLEALPQGTPAFGEFVAPCLPFGQQDTEGWRIADCLLQKMPVICCPVYFNVGGGCQAGCSSVCVGSRVTAEGPGHMGSIYPPQAASACRGSQG